MHRTTLSQLRLASFPKHTILGSFRCLNFRFCYQNVWAKHGFLGWATKNAPGEENVRSLTIESLKASYPKTPRSLPKVVVVFWGGSFWELYENCWFTMLILLIWSHSTCWSRWWTCGGGPRHGANLLAWRHYHAWLPPLTALCLGHFLWPWSGECYHLREHRGGGHPTDWSSAREVLHMFGWFWRNLLSARHCFHSRPMFEEKQLEKLASAESVLQSVTQNWRTKRRQRRIT